MTRREEILSDKYFVKTNTCWNWIRSKDPKGYGIVSYENSLWKAHRLVYEFIVGKIPEDMTIDHLCMNTSCVNPVHLEVVTLEVNVMRGGGICANYSRRTHCKSGHEYTKENTYLVGPKKWRRCISCRLKWKQISLGRKTRKASGI